MHHSRLKPQYWISLLLLLLLVVRGSFFYLHLQRPLDVSGASYYQVKPGQSLTQVAHDMESRGILNNAFDLLMFARLMGLADRIQAGEYALEEGMSPLQLLYKLGRGEVYLHQVVLLEGWTVEQALLAIQKSDFIKVTLDPGDEAALQQSLGLQVRPEGEFFPDTYKVARDTTDREVLLQAHALMQEVLTREWQSRDVGLPYENPYQALIMASIVEKETAVATEREQIAGVFVRRLQRGMRLQTDPTVIYGLGTRYNGNLTRADLREDTPYNTYTRAGLPPTPIAMPGLDSIVASLHPGVGDTLYFVAKGDGTHYFSSTLAEHNEAVRRYQVDRASVVVPDSSAEQGSDNAR